MDGLSFATFHVPAEHIPLPHAIFLPYVHMRLHAYCMCICDTLYPESIHQQKNSPFWLP